MNYFKPACAGRPISISLSPNVEKDDVKLALNLIIRPWLWRGSSLRANAKQSQTPSDRLPRRLLAPRNDAVRELENEFKKYLGAKYAFSFNSGRSSLYAILRALQEVDQTAFAKGSGVLIQAFTCNASINPVLWANLEPVYVDCNSADYNVDIEDLKIKITPESRVLMIQHTFGLPANIEEVLKICKNYNLTLIEDCAHSLGAKYNNQLAGTFGKAAFFSFSRDKIISSVYGGMAVTNDDEIGKRLEELQKKFGQPSRFWIFQQILHPILLRYLILPVYNFLDLGKAMLVFSQITHLLSKAVSWKEKRGKKPDYFPKALPNAMAIMALNQFGKLEKFELHRKNIAEIYYNELSGTKFTLPKKFPGRESAWLRFTIQHKDAHEIIYQAWHKQNILLGDWYTTVIAPFDTKLDEMHYKTGMCPNAEWLAKRTLNLPTHVNISQTDLKRIINFLKNYK